ncbi:BREX-2 system adenine-specific DNA-methyltransferase PglX [Caballeronia sp. LZ001]|uniref:BREX-2 system adenine-specific DNA-methyltransferase PglX n=1 Tax=Caballeronia sp. LZ001 TaxID=3038553 RepID=UPI0028548DBF|nr:BREX-2 system adenine-specific DNA-methyltransferase PglX [Caballeronia sp. LZ001]MDR5803478.1 BREX-2 system adenine-specific DNA-methyltransferase PglX [Caballeronia sp. LZ001]
MIDPKILLTDLTRLLRRLEDDLRERALSPDSGVPALRAQLQAEWQAACDAERTAETFESWVEQVVTQAGVHWLLSCVFLRFIEDNALVDRPWLSGTPQSGRLALARDRHDAYFREHPHESDRDYLLLCFREAGALPGLHTFFDEAHNPVFRLGISGDAAMAVMQFWQEVAADSGTLVRDFTDPTWNTRFLGDLYQDLSEATRKRYALLQTPEFVEEFILDRTLTPAIREFGYREVRMIDPTCGSGHFLLGGFHRMVDEWSRNEPALNRRDVAQKALDAVAGVDLNPFAVAIARFRLLLAALQANDVHRMTDAPDFRVNVAIGDSLLHGQRYGLTGTDDMFQSSEHFTGTGLGHTYASEDLTDVQRILGWQYHAVVGNPPYIVVKDAALNRAYRQIYASCHKKYSLGCPFTERFFDLAVTGKVGQSAGFVGLITTNSFMKREFGSKLIEEVLPRLDLTHVIDSSGAWIPGHNRDGTATVILFGRHRAPVSDTVRTVVGMRHEPSTPQDPARGLVWSAIVEQLDQVGSASEFVSVSDAPRPEFCHHPWSIGGAGVGDLLEQIEDASATRLGEISDAIGRTTHTGEDNVFCVSPSWVTRNRVAGGTVSLIEGEHVRNYGLTVEVETIFPYDRTTAAASEDLPTRVWQHFWMFRRLLKERRDFGNFIEERGLRWYEHSMFFPNRYRKALGIAFADIATHNHFVLDHGGKVFNRTAPVIKLAGSSTEDDHLGLLGLLNSSVSCFWLKQVCFPKDGQGRMWEERFAFNATNVTEFPLIEQRPVDLSRRIDALARALAAALPGALLAAASAGTQQLPTRADLDIARTRTTQLRHQMIALQEELDWHCYGLYRLLPDSMDASTFRSSAPPDVRLGERAFEIVLARRVADGSTSTNWFERHGSTAITEIPAHWPESYRQVVECRIALIKRDASIGLLEQPLYKRRWNAPSWHELEKAALLDWLLTRLESPRYWTTSADQPPQLSSTSRLADIARQDADFMQVAALYADHADFDPSHLVAELVANEAVPFMQVLRYADSGLRKRAQWQETWTLQRREDEIDERVDATAGLRRQRLMASARDAASGSEPDASALQLVETTLRTELDREKAERKAAEVGKIPVPAQVPEQGLR